MSNDSIVHHMNPSQEDSEELKTRINLRTQPTTGPYKAKSDRENLLFLPGEISR
jgi:hypothetical protein